MTSGSRSREYADAIDETVAGLEGNNKGRQSRAISRAATELSERFGVEREAVESDLKTRLEQMSQGPGAPEWEL